MSAGTLGRVDEFDETKDDWLQYVERLEHFLAANGIDDANKKRAVLLTVVGAATYETLRNIVFPKKPGEKTYAELVAALSKHFRPTPSEIVELFKFHSRVRKAGELIATYVAELRALSEYCNFGATLDDMLRDRLVCGVNDQAIQKQLLRRPWSWRCLQKRLHRVCGNSESSQRAVPLHVSRRRCIRRAPQVHLQLGALQILLSLAIAVVARGTLPPAARWTETLSVTTVTSESTCSECVSLRAGFPHPRPNASLSQSVKFRMRERERPPYFREVSHSL